MKATIHKFIISTNFVLIALTASGQSVQDYIDKQDKRQALVGANNYTPTVQTREFIRYGNTPVDLYTGTARVEIPVYTYSDQDFTIPVSLSYASSGFMPSQQTGPVGLNWTLNAGGMVSREIRGLDDFNGKTEQGAKGFLNTNLCFNDETLLRESTELGMDMVWWKYPEIKNYKETESDIYFFNFPGHSGMFHYDGQQNCKVYNTDGNNDAYKVNWSKVDSEAYFVITTPDGYKYTFGKANKTEETDEFFRERYIPGHYTTEWVYKLPEYTFEMPVTTWSLSKITAPNGRYVSFSYTNGALGKNTIAQYPQDISNYVFTFAKQTIDNPYHPENQPSIFNPSYVKINTPKQYSKGITLIKTTYLSEIDIDGKVKISFTYEPKEVREVDSLKNIGTFYDRTVPRLDRLKQIRVKGLDNKTLVSCELSYQTQDRRPLLNQVSISNEGHYKMEYYTGQTFPNILSNNYDFWGFANGIPMPDESAYAGTHVDGVQNEYIGTGSCKRPNATYSIIGNLKKICYPLGGTTSFEYESHQAEMAVLQRNAPGLLAASGIARKSFEADLYPFSVLKTNDNLVGGVRIKRITDDNGAGCITSRKFKYTTPAGKSSGILLSFPRLVTRQEAIPGGATVSILMRQLAFSRTTFDKTHIEYSRVVEEHSDGSSVAYNFTNYQNTPDDYIGQNSRKINYPAMENSTMGDNMRRATNSHHLERGKISLMNYYDNSGKEVKREEFVYKNHNANEPMNYSSFAVHSERLVWSAKLYTGDNRPIAKRTTLFLPDGNTTEHQTFTYTPSGRPRGTYTKYQDGIILGDSLVYISESRAPQIVQRNVDLPEEYHRVKIIGGSSPVKLLTKKFTYTLTIKKVPVLKKVQVCLLPSAQNNQYETTASYTGHDTSGRLLEQIDDKDNISCIIWGYGGLYPIAKIENTDFVSLQSGLATIPGMEKLITPLEGGLNPEQEMALRALPNILVTTYQYIPFVGLSRITGPTGNTTTYEYSFPNRLSLVRDIDGIPVTKYDIGTIYLHSTIL